MKTLLNRIINRTISEVNTLTAPTKTVNQLVDEIHESFMTEVDRLLEEAKIAKSTDTDKGDLIDKAKTLENLGFKSAKETIEGNAEIIRLRKVEEENANKKKLIDAINYFSTKYPQYKFITEESVKTICEKYGLIYGDVAHYIGTVPDENLEQMKEFKISDDDACYDKIVFAKGVGFSQTRISPVSKAEVIEYDSESTGFGVVSTSYSKSPLEIAAPSSDFNLEGKEIKGFKLSIKPKAPDPVVLQPVFYNGQKYYLIVTAWGKEAEDNLVINDKLN